MGFKSEFRKNEMVYTIFKNNCWSRNYSNIPNFTIARSESEFNEFEPRLKSAKNRFQLIPGLNLKVSRGSNS